jgi:hypothetical protein
LARKILSALFTVAVFALGSPVLVAPPAVAAGPPPVITDPAGDATGFIVEGVLPVPNEPSLDILAADLAVNATTLTATIVVADLTADAPPLASGRYFRWYFSYGGRGYLLVADESTPGAAVVEFSDPDGTVDCPNCTVAMNVDSETVTLTLPLATLNAEVTAANAAVPPVGPGARLYQLNVISQRSLLVVTPTADSASTDLGYTVPGGTGPAPVPTIAGPDETGDAVVVAVIDSGVVPYHWDFSAAHMPQQLDTDPTNDLPLNRPPNEWLPGFPNPSTFASYQSLNLHLAPNDPNASITDLDGADTAAWDAVKPSTGDQLNYYWLPDTKVIGAVEFGSGHIHGTTDDHGVGTTSVSVGNIHGTCPECLLLFINTDGNASIEAALHWAEAQPWIDVISNSYGINLIGDVPGAGVGVRDNVYFGRPAVEDARAASMRGQSIFFSAGNGLENAFVVPNATYTSALKGPDWTVTVGATTPGLDDESGSGKPVDVSGIGEAYPSAYTSVHVGGTGATGFSGTSNATPTIAGIYSRALHEARRLLTGPSRTQEYGIVAKGRTPFPCGPARPGCELGDGALTAVEIRDRLLLGAVHRNGAIAIGGLVPVPKPLPDLEYADNGHGVYTARLSRVDRIWLSEVEQVVGPLAGRTAAAARPDGERDWMIVDSFCRQRLWGGWPGGYYQSGRTKVPGLDPAWPLRSALAAACHGLPPFSTF